MENFRTLEHYVVLPPSFDTHWRGVGPHLKKKIRSGVSWWNSKFIRRLFVALDKLSTLCPNSIQFHYIPLQFSIKFEQECNNNFIIALLLGLQCNNNLLLHSCSNFIQNQFLINETNITLPTVPALKIFWLSIKSFIPGSYLVNLKLF